MLIARFCIAFLTTVVCWLLLDYVEDVNSNYLPKIIIFAFAYIISSIFISVFDAGANPILQCYLIDVDISRQSNLEPTHVP